MFLDLVLFYVDKESLTRVAFILLSMLRGNLRQAFTTSTRRGLILHLHGSAGALTSGFRGDISAEIRIVPPCLDSLMSPGWRGSVVRASGAPTVDA